MKEIQCLISNRFGTIHHYYKGIKKYHSTKVENKKNPIECFLFCLIVNLQLFDIKDNDWYETEYDGVLCSGKIIKCINREFETIIMQPKGKY